MAPQVTFFVYGPAPNPLKIAILLKELGVEYAMDVKEIGDGPNGIKGPNFLKINPNGRIPTLIDHTNNDHVVWESGAILLCVGVLEKRPEKEGEWTVRKRFTVADMANSVWINNHEYASLSLVAYREGIQALPSLQRAYTKVLPTAAAAA